MMMALIVAGAVALLSGLLAIFFGIPVKEFSFGNTLILSGCIGGCTGLILLGLSAVAAELKLIARHLAAAPRSAADARVRAALPQASSGGPSLPNGAAEGGFQFSRNQTAAEQAGQLAPTSPPPWQEESRARQDSPEPQPTEAMAPPTKPKRSLLFASSMRRDRERSSGRAADGAAPSDVRGQEPAAEAGESPPNFETTWPKTERARGGDNPPQRRSSRAAPAESPAAPIERTPPAQREDQPAVTVLKSGVVDGMAYSLYSDGSIEAQMPEGLMRFASLDELTAHIERRL